MLDIKKLANDKTFRIILGCTAGLIVLTALTFAAAPNELNIYINNGSDCKIARKINAKAKKDKRSKKS